MAKIRVLNEVLKEITAVRDADETNILDMPAVARLAEKIGLDEAAR